MNVYLYMPATAEEVAVPTRKALSGHVALVAGATRGAGRGIACALGDAGATVYCSGRSTREHPSSTGFYAGRPETIEETAEMVTARGGKGIAVRTDHLDPEQVQSLVTRIEKDHTRLDVLVNDISEGDRHDWQPFWKVDVEKGFTLLRNALHTHIITCRFAVPLMVRFRRFKGFRGFRRFKGFKGFQETVRQAPDRNFGEALIVRLVQNLVANRVSGKVRSHGKARSARGCIHREIRRLRKADSDAPEERGACGLPERRRDDEVERSALRLQGHDVRHGGL
jgi:NAD(P)-dependent dehydrogenase (short-subunit alcohol dehydrogenase family)